MDAKALLSAVRSAQGWPSNYRLARELGIPDNSVQRWNTGLNTPDDAVATRLAELAGLDPDVVVAHMMAIRSKKNPTEAARWQRIAQRLQSVAAVFLAAILSGFISGGPDAHARAPVDASSVAPAHVQQVDRLYIVRSFVRRLVAWLSSVSALSAVPAPMSVR